MSPDIQDLTKELPWTSVMLAFSCKFVMMLFNEAVRWTELFWRRKRV